MEALRRHTGEYLRGAFTRLQYINFRGLNNEVDKVLVPGDSNRDSKIRGKIAKIDLQLTAADRFGLETGFFYHYQLGRLHLELDEKEVAMSHFEQGVVQHPRRSEEDFALYVGGYLTAIRTYLQQDVIPHLNDWGRKDAIRGLERAMDSAANVLALHSDLEEVGMERYAAGAHYQRATGRRPKQRFKK